MFFFFYLIDLRMNESCFPPSLQETVMKPCYKEIMNTMCPQTSTIETKIWHKFKKNKTSLDQALHYSPQNGLQCRSLIAIISYFWVQGPKTKKKKKQAAIFARDCMWEA